MKKTSWAGAIILFIAAASVISCRAHQTTSNVVSDRGQQPNLNSKTDDLLQKTNDHYLNHKGLKGVLFLTYGQLIVLGKLAPVDVQNDPSQIGLVGLIARQEQIMYGADLRQTGGGLVNRTKVLAKDVADLVQAQSVKRGLNFKLQLARMALASSSVVPQSDGSIFDELDVLTKAVEALPDL